MKLFLTTMTALALLPTSSLLAQDNEWIGGSSTDYHNAANWSLGVVPTSVQTAVIDNTATDTDIDISTSVSVGSVTINSGDKLTVTNSRSLTVDGLGGPTLFSNDGEFIIESLGSTTSLILNEQSLLDGLGVVTLSGVNSRIYSSNNSQLQQGAGHTIRGNGSLGFNSMSIVNDGLIVADSGTLRIDPDTNGLQNNGVMRADGGDLVLSGFGGGGFTNTGSIEALDGSNVLLESAAQIDGGTFSTSGSGTIRVQSGNASVSDINNQGALVVENARTLGIQGGVTNDGTIDLATAGSATIMSLQADTTIDGVGTTTLGGTAARIGGGAFTLTNNGTHTIDGSGDLGYNQIGLVNNSTIQANVAGAELEIDPESTLGATNNGIMRATNGGILTLSGFGGGTFQNNGTIAADNDSQVNLVSGAEITNGVIESSGTGKFVVGSGNATINDLSNNGLLQVANARTLATSGILQNNGTIETDSLGSSTSIYLNADTTFSGMGNARLQNSAARITGAGGSVLTQGSQHTIAGHGLLGTNQLTINNSGDIVADTGTLTVDPSVDGLVNTGTMKATSGGNLLLNGFGGGDFTNNGVIRAEDASTVELINAAKVIGGNLESIGSGEFRVSSGNATLQDLTFSGNLTTENARTLALAGLITNNGQMSTQSSGSATQFSVQGPTTLTGMGAINLQNSAASLNGVSGSLLTQEANHTIQGFGSVGKNNVGIQNLGTITASGGTLTVDPHATDGLSNLGLMQAESGATLNLNGFGSGVFTNTGGTILANDGGQVTMDGGAEIVGGLLNSMGTGSFSVGSGNATISDLTTSANISIENARTLATNGLITNHGLIGTESAGSSTTLYLASDTQFNGTGAIQLQRSVAQVTGVSGNLLTNGVDHSIEGFGAVGTNALNIDNLGTISANVSGETLLLNPATGGMVNSGSLRAENGGQLVFDDFGGGGYSGAGSVNAFDGSSVVFESGSDVANLSAGVLQSGSWNAMETGSGALIDFQQSPVAISQIGTNASVSLSGAGAVIQSGGFSLSDSLTSNLGQLNVAAGHIMSTASLQNGGEVLVDGNASLISTDDYTQVSGVTTLSAGGGISGMNAVDFQAGLVQGNGTLYGDTTLDVAATMAAGQSAGILDIVGNADLLGTLEIEIAGIQVDGMNQDAMLVNRGTDYSLAQFDQVNVLGDLLLDGALDVSFIDGYSLTGSEFFDVVTADSLTLGSSFSIVNGTDADFTYSVETLTDSVSGGQRDVLRLNGFSAVPEPTASLVLCGLAGALTLRRRRRA